MGSGTCTVEEEEGEEEREEVVCRVHEERARWESDERLERTRRMDVDSNAAAAADAASAVAAAVASPTATSADEEEEDEEEEEEDKEVGFQVSILSARGPVCDAGLDALMDAASVRVARALCNFHKCFTMDDALLSPTSTSLPPSPPCLEPTVLCSLVSSACECAASHSLNAFFDAC